MTSNNKFNFSLQIPKQHPIQVHFYPTPLPSAHVPNTQASPLPLPPLVQTPSHPPSQSHHAILQHPYSQLQAAHQVCRHTLAQHSRAYESSWARANQSDKDTLRRARARGYSPRPPVGYQWLRMMATARGVRHQAVGETRCRTLPIPHLSSAVPSRA